MRLGKRLEIFAQSDFIHSFTRYLDDVDGTYRESYDNDFQAYAAKPGPNAIDPTTRNRGENNGNNDWIIYHGVGLKFNFGASKKSFQAPTLSTYYPDYGTPKTIKKSSTEEKDESNSDFLQETKAGDTYNYYTNIQLVDQLKLDSLSYRTQILTWEQQINDLKDRILQSRFDERNLLDIQNQVNDQFSKLKADTVLIASKKDSLLRATENSVTKVKLNLDSIRNRKIQFEAEKDSIYKLRDNYKIQPKIENTSLNDLLSPMNISRSMASISRITAEGDVIIKTQELSMVDSTRKKLPQQLLAKRREVDGEVMERRVDALQKPTSTTEQGNLNKIKEQEDRISNLETESRRLQTERDSLSRLPREFIYMQNSSILPSPRTNRETSTADYGKEDRIEKRKKIKPKSEKSNLEKNRNLFQSIGAFFAGAAVSRAISPKYAKEEAMIEMDSSRAIQEDPIPAPVSPRDSINLTILRLQKNIVNEDSLKLRISKQSKEFERESQQKLSELPQKIKGVPREILKDSVFSENNPLVRLLRYKENIYFDINQRIPSEEELKKIENMVDFIRKNDGYQLTLTGYADNTGNINYNLKLADDRTKAIGDALVRQFGISVNNITLESGGQVVRGSQRSSNDQDRKVEVRIERKN